MNDRGMRREFGQALKEVQTRALQAALKDGKDTRLIETSSPPSCSPQPGLGSDSFESTT